MIKSPNGTIGPFQANPTVVDSPILSGNKGLQKGTRENEKAPTKGRGL
jgi:hypothetical protein